jgi:hypothetical protein
MTASSMCFKLSAIIDKELKAVQHQLEVLSGQTELFTGSDNNPELTKLQKTYSELHDLKNYITAYRPGSGSIASNTISDTAEGEYLDLIEKLERFEHEHLSNAWEHTFIDDIKKRIQIYGSKTRLSKKQADVIERILEHSPELLIIQIEPTSNTNKPF